VFGVFAGICDSAVRVGGVVGLHYV
jgi:hypothetical protein